VCNALESSWKSTLAHLSTFSLYYSVIVWASARELVILRATEVKVIADWVRNAFCTFYERN
jgi:hypothetical protein